MTIMRIVAPSLLAAMAGLAAWMQPQFDEKNADPGTVAGTFTAAPKAQPGRWEATLAVESREGAALPVRTRFATCLGPDDAIQPPAVFFAAGQPGCTFQNYAQAEGRLQGALSCLRGGKRSKVTFSGTYAADSFEVHSLERARLPGGDASLGVSMSARRAGDCRGDEVHADPA